MIGYCVASGRSLERPTLESLGPNDKPIAIPQQYFAAVSGPIEKDEQITCENALVELIVNDSMQPIETLPHVGIVAMDEYTDFGAER
jgi:hypothetical protein